VRPSAPPKTGEQMNEFRHTQVSGHSAQVWQVPNAARTVFELLMMSGKPARNMYSTDNNKRILYNVASCWLSLRMKQDANCCHWILPTVTVALRSSAVIQLVPAGCRRFNHRPLTLWCASVPEVWGFRWSVVWRRVVGWVVPDVSMVHNAVVCRG